MIISSRTPEGQPNHCPICKSDVCIDPSPMFGDATCPNCGSLLWFLNLSGERVVVERTSSVPLRERVIEIIAQQLGVDKDKVTADTSFIADWQGDSLDAMELVMEFEEETGQR